MFLSQGLHFITQSNTANFQLKTTCIRGVIYCKILCQFLIQRPIRWDKKKKERNFLVERKFLVLCFNSFGAIFDSLTKKHEKTFSQNLLNLINLPNTVEFCLDVLNISITIVAAEIIIYAFGQTHIQFTYIHRYL